MPLRAPRARARGLPEAPVATLHKRGSERAPFFFFFFTVLYDAACLSPIVVSLGAARVFICFFFLLPRLRCVFIFVLCEVYDRFIFRIVERNHPSANMWIELDETARFAASNSATFFLRRRRRERGVRASRRSADRRGARGPPVKPPFRI